MIIYADDPYVKEKACSNCIMISLLDFFRMKGAVGRMAANNEHGAGPSFWLSIGHAPLWTSTHMLLVRLKDKPCSEWTRISLLNVSECRGGQPEEFSRTDDYGAKRAI